MYKLPLVISSLLLSHSILLQAQAPKAASIPLEDKIPEVVVATINDDTITQAQIDTFQMALQQQLRGQAVDRDLLVEEIIKSSLLSQAAEKEGIDSRPEIVEALRLQRRTLLSTLMLQELSKRLEPTEDELNEIYGNVPNKEFRVNYILVKEEAVANEVLKKLKEGASFSSLAHRHSIDPTSRHGGNLGWVNGLQFGKDMIDTIKSLKVGKYTRSPVKSSQGWQLVQLLEKRPFSKPAYIETRDQLFQLVLQEKMSNHIDELKSKANITINP